jgi:protease IV
VSSRRGILIIVVLIVLAAVVSLAGLLFIGLFSSPPPSVPANSALYFRVRAPFAEVEPDDVLSQFVNRPLTLRQTIEEIRKAKRDTRIKALVVVPETSGALWGQLQEVRDALLDFKSSGKPLTAFLEYGGAEEYFVATAADRIVMMPAGQLDLAGMASYELFFRGALDKLGVFPDLLHIGEYKTASNTFTEKTFTPAHKEMTTSLNHDWYEQLITAIAANRKKTDAEIRQAIDKGPFTAKEAQEAGLVDALSYEDQLDDTAPLQGTRRMNSLEYERVFVSMPQVETSGKIALLYAAGTIASGRSSFDGGSEVVGSDTFVEWLRKVRGDPGIRAVVVRIDSPGGSAIASEVMWRELMLTRDAKPLIVSMGDVAASGGYYIAAPANVIVAEPGTITGSIGVVTGKFVLGGTADKLGVGYGAVSEGKMAQVYSPFTPFSKEERAHLSDQMQSTYDLFVSRVAEGRKATNEKIDGIGKGRVWTGHQAKELGLVDELGGLDSAIKIAQQRAKLDLSRAVNLVIYPQKRTLFEALSDPLGSGSSMSARVLFKRPDLPTRMLESAAARLNLFHRGEMLTLMPNVFWK